jgi:hypothetical protein
LARLEQEKAPSSRPLMRGDHDLARGTECGQKPGDCPQVYVLESGKIELSAAELICAATQKSREPILESKSSSDAPSQVFSMIFS